jgi:hypothetical protein
MHTGRYSRLPGPVSVALHPGQEAANRYIQLAATAVLRAQVLAEAAWAMLQQPVTVTAEGSPRSAGGRHDFFSEADYFWPDPKNPDGPISTAMA